MIYVRMTSVKSMELMNPYGLFNKIYSDTIRILHFNCFYEQFIVDIINTVLSN